VPTSTPAIADTLLILNAVALVPAIISLIASVAGAFISKEKDFDAKIGDLLSKFLDKKVASLRLLLESIQFVPDSIGEVKEFKGKTYYTEVDKFSMLERDISIYRKIYRRIISMFHYCIAATFLLCVLSFIKFPYSSPIIVSISILLLVLAVIGILTMRRFENKISKISDMPELRHQE
jgi:hypothetical protein